MYLSNLKIHQSAIITGIVRSSQDKHDIVASRLETLGFLAGTPVKVVAKGLFGGEPILVQIGFTRFALRKNEADHIQVEITKGAAS